MSWMQAVLAALGSVHEAGVAHGDIWRKNVPLAGDVQGYLLDFGAAHFYTNVSEAKAEKAPLWRILGHVGGVWVKGKNSVGASNV